MDLFLVSKATTKPEYGPFIIAGLGALAFVALYKFLSVPEEPDSDGEPKQQSPGGIYNEGNTCFVNSILQALSSVQSFQKLLKRTCKQFRGHPTPNQLMIIQLSKVIEDINASSETISVGSLLNSINEIKQGLINLEQQDAHELYAAIIGAVETVLNGQKNMDLTASVKLLEQEEEEQEENPLVGYIKTSITCLSCKTETAIKIDPFYDLSLDITKMYVVSLRAALYEFQKQQKIDHWICSTCSIATHRRKLKQSISMLKGPSAEKLTFIGKAFVDFLQETDFAECDVREINGRLGQFATLYQTEYEGMAEEPQRNLIFLEIEGIESSIIKRAVITKYPTILVLHIKQLIINPNTGEPYLLKKHISFDETLIIEGKHKKREYRLTGLLTHLGNELYGHYMTYRRANREAEQWFAVSDSSSKVSSWEAVSHCKAYMLFYETT